MLARAGLGSDTSPAASGPPDQSGRLITWRRPCPSWAPRAGAFAVHAEAYADSSAFVREAILELGQSRARPYTFLRWYRGVLRAGRRGTTGYWPRALSLSLAPSKAIEPDGREVGDALRSPRPRFS